MTERQVTFNEIGNTHSFKPLTRNQRKIITLLGLQLTQSDIARKLGFSRSYVNRIKKRLESLGLIKRLSTQSGKEGTREYNLFYEVCPDVRIPDIEFTACRVHNVRKKFTIIRQSEKVSTDSRASYTKSWQMRGWQGHKYWYAGKAGLPSVTVDVNPKSLIIYIDKGQRIIAKDTEQSKEIAWYAIYQARDKFVEQQSKFGIQFEIERAGEDIAKIHGGFAIGEKTAEEGVHTRGWWIDKSETKEMSYAEAETDIPEGMSRLDRTIKLSEKIETLEALPEAMKEINAKLNPMNTNILQVQALMQGGITISQQYEQMVNFMTKALDEMAAIRRENAELKKRLGV
jgi:DNA-binding transcriptional regulator GbsR (MarR family)